MPTENRAVALLDELGLTEYEARCFVALSRVQKASASEIHTLSDVLRSRVYDSVERLHRKEFVDIQQTDPRHTGRFPEMPSSSAFANSTRPRSRPPMMPSRSSDRRKVWRSRARGRSPITIT